MSFAPAAAQKPLPSVTLDYDRETVEGSFMRPAVDGELLFAGVLTPQLEQAKKAWGALLAVHAGQAGDLQLAVAAIKGLDPTHKDLPRAAAYVVSWVRLRQGDFAGAAQAMDAALTGWTLTSALSVVRRELLMMHALAGSEVAQAIAALGNQAPRTPFLMILAEEYNQAGDKPRRLGALKLAEEGADRRTLATIRELQISTEFDSDHPDRVVTLSRAQLAETAREVAAQAKAYEWLFHSSHDDRHRAAASELYALVQAAPLVASASEQQARVAMLAPAQPSALSQLAARPFMRMHYYEVVGCYYHLLQTDPTLVGVVDLYLAVDKNGIVASTTATPQGPGSRSLSALGQCVARQAKTWRFPRSTPTTIRQPYTFSSGE